MKRKMTVPEVSSAAIIAAAALLAGMTLGACTERDDGRVTLNFWHIYADDSRRVPIEEAVRRFEAENPGTRVVITIYGNDPYKTRMRIVGEDGFPDVFHHWGGGWLESFVDAGFVADLSAEADALRDVLNPALVGLNAFGGKVYGLPYSAGITILYYNREIFGRLGIRPPENFAELSAVSDTLIANGIIPFAEANRTKWPGAQHFVLLAMRLGGGDIFTRAQAGDVPFTDPAFVRAGGMLIDMVNAGRFPAGVNGMDWDTGQSRILFYTGQAAMLLQTGGFLSTCRSENRDFYDNRLGLSFYPVIEGSPGVPGDLLAGQNAVSASARSRHPELARRLAVFLATDRRMQQEFLDNGIISSLPGLDTSDRHVRAALDQLDAATYLQNYIDQSLPLEMAELHKDTVQALFGGTMTPEQAARAMQNAFDETR